MFKEVWEKMKLNEWGRQKLSSLGRSKSCLLQMIVFIATYHSATIERATHRSSDIQVFKLFLKLGHDLLHLQTNHRKQALVCTHSHSEMVDSRS